MASKVIAALVTLFINLAIGVAVLFFMIIAMNGYHGSDAEPGLLTYVILAGLTSFVMAAASWLLTGALISRKFHAAVAVLLSGTAFSIVGGIIMVIACFIGIGVAEYVRVNY